MNIELKPEYLHELFDYNAETGVLVWRTRPRDHFNSDRAWNMTNAKRSGKIAGTIQSKGYRSVEITKDGKTYSLRAYRVIWAMMMGKWPTAEVDHVDLDKDNNRWINLREATHIENCCNRPVRSDSKTGVKGVHLDERGRFKASICLKGKSIYLGRFNSAEEASQAYATKAAELHGEFARPA